MSDPEKRQKIERLACEGATDGERAAARAALSRLDSKVDAPCREYSSAELDAIVLKSFINFVNVAVILGHNPKR